jgi:hypothetical protein
MMQVREALMEVLGQDTMCGIVDKLELSDNTNLKIVRKHLKRGLCRPLQLTDLIRQTARICGNTILTIFGRAKAFPKAKKHVY